MTKNQELMAPALKAKMGDWVYYITFLRMEDIASRVSIAEEIHTSKALKDLIQRQVTKRADEISEYLRSQPQRFFNALVVGVYGGSPRWYELAIGENRYFDPETLPSYIEGALGILRLNGTEKLFAIDGQHRVAGIRQAVKVSADILQDEELCVIFLAHSNDPKGMERTRRLFTTLNRYAKPVSMMDIIALDEDDAIAITTRALVDNHPLFAGPRISIVKGKAIPSKDKECVTTIVTLYEVLDILLADKKGKAWAEFKRLRPDASYLSGAYERAMRFWNTMVQKFAPLKEVQDGPSGKSIAGRYRHGEGGHLLFRPVGLLSVARAIRYAQEAGMTISSAIKLVSRTPIDLAKAPWVGLLWDSVSKRMITRKENQQVASRLLFYMIGGDLTKLKTDEQRLKQQYAAALNKPVSEITLPPKVRQTH